MTCNWASKQHKCFPKEGFTWNDETACRAAWGGSVECPDGVGPKGVWMTNADGGYCAKWDSDAALLGIQECFHEGTITTCTKMSVKHVHSTPEQWGLLLSKRIRCDAINNECSTYKYGKCIDVGETVFSSHANNHIADMASELQVYAEKAIAILEGGTPGPLNTMWSTVDGALKQVAVSSSGAVWGVTSNGNIYTKSSPTAARTQVSGVSLKQVAVGGDHVWGVTSSDAVYYRDGSSWVRASGALKQVAVSSNGTVWGVNSKDAVYTKSSPTAAWTYVSGSLKQVAVGGDHVWGVTSNDAISYLSIGDGTCAGRTHHLDLIVNRLAID